MTKIIQIYETEYDLVYEWAEVAQRDALIPIEVSEEKIQEWTDILQKFEAMQVELGDLS